MSSDVHPENSRQPEKIRLYPWATVPEKPLFRRPMIPRGITIHYTAGGRASTSMKFLREQGLGYHLIIDRDGHIYQMYYLDSTCSHAGNANWNDLSPNRHHIAVALANYGPLSPTPGGYRTAYGNKITDGVSRNGRWWEPATDDQEQALIDICRWLCQNQEIDSKNICGHDECCVPTGRKTDPGGILSFRPEWLRSLFNCLPRQR